MEAVSACSSGCLYSSRFHSSLPSSSLRNGVPNLFLLCPSRRIYFSTTWRRRHPRGHSAKFPGRGIRVLAKGANGAPFVPNSAESDRPRSKAVSGTTGKMRLEPFGGKSGCVSFYGLTYHALEDKQLVSSPFKEGRGSMLWIVGPLALISSLLLPQVLISNAVEGVLSDEILAEIVSTTFSEATFYVGFATFLSVVDRVQKPYLEFSAKRWSLITGLKGYLSSVFFTMGLKVMVPLLAAYAAWPIIGLPAVVSVAPFLIGCGVQFMFESMLSRSKSSCWPLVPIIFEVYRLYQLTRGANFIQRLMFSIQGSATSPEMLHINGAFLSMFVVFQALGIVCLWSLMTFLIRLFPSRPVAENY